MNTHQCHLTQQNDSENHTSTKEDVRRFYNFKSMRTVEKLMAEGAVPYLKIGKLVRFDMAAVKLAMNERFGRNRRAA